MSIRLGSGPTSTCPGKAPARIVSYFLDAMLGGGEMVAVENPDSVARKQRGQGGDHRRDDRLHPFCSGADQRGREDQFKRLSSLL